MTAIDPSARQYAPRASWIAPAILAVFAGTLFLSAMLLFSLQPMFAKMVLPLLGGSPGVWSVAMVFFQAVLLLGYAYAHLLVRMFGPARALSVHLIVFACALFFLPVAMATGLGSPPAEFAAFWLIGVFGLSVGVPYFAVAANAPLLQAWFSQTGHPQAHDPYFLYGASNFGSFAALLAYPFLIEPFLALHTQSAVWSLGFMFLMAAVVTCGAIAAFAHGRGVAGSPAGTGNGAVTARDRMTWMALAFVPSALLVAVTAHITTDIASIPFLWVIPLALFLATFVAAFRTGGDGIHHWMLRLQPIVVAPLIIGLMQGERSYWLVALALELGMFVISAMICHRELFLRRPAVSRLTEFYMWISAGGVLGGIAAGLVAPLVFPDIWEYPLLIVLALLCRPAAMSTSARQWIRDGAPIAAVVIICLLPGMLFGTGLSPDAELVWNATLVLAAAVIMLQAHNPVRLAGLTAAVLLLTAIYQPGAIPSETHRSFFGVHKVVQSYDGRFRLLFHGTTVHGAERIRDDAGRAVSGAPEPLTYYHRRGPMAEAIATLRNAKGGLSHVGIVGLGAGSLACYAMPGEQWTFFEIDPVVAMLARDPAQFRFLSGCAPDAKITLGDARLTLAGASQRADILVLDAFSSDVVPVHLLTREAVALYTRKLSEGGIVVFHISNRYLELAGVVAAIARANGLSVLVKRDDSVGKDDFKKNMYAPSIVAVAARRAADLSAFSAASGWHAPGPRGDVEPWTDDYANVLSAIWRMHRAR